MDTEAPGEMLAASLAVTPTTTNPALDEVARAAAGDRRAFEALYRQNLNRVFSVCVRMCGDHTRAEELTQDVFVRAWEKLPLFRGESAFSTWLHRLAVNVVLNARKIDRRDRSRLEDERQDEGQGAGVDAIPMRRGEHHADRLDLEAAIAALPPGARTVFVLHDVEGYKHEEIAELLGVTAGGSKAQLHRARLLLREALTR